MQEEKDRLIYEVLYDDGNEKDDIFINEIDQAYPNTLYQVICGEKVTCNCGFFESSGMICRHVFFICSCNNIKDVTKLCVSKRWSLSLEEPAKHFVNPIKEKDKPISNEIPTTPQPTPIMNDVQQASNHLMFNQTSEESSDEEEKTDEKIQVVLKNTRHRVITNFDKVTAKKGAPKKGKFCILLITFNFF